MHAETESLPDRPPAASIEFLSGTDPVQEHALTEENIFTIPEFHPEKMHIMPAMSEPDRKFPYAFFHTTFYVGIDDVSDECDLHGGNLYVIVVLMQASNRTEFVARGCGVPDLVMVIVLIQQHHTLEDGKEKDLDTAHDQDKGSDGC